MLFIRGLLFNIGLILTLLFIAFIAILFLFLPFKYRYKIISNWAKFCIWWLKITCNLNFKIIGTENIPVQPCVVISNHQSTWDTLIFQTILPPQTWVLKKELLFIPIFGWGLALLKPIIINRNNKLKALRQIIKQGVKRLRNNIWVIIYPEGTRQPYNKLGKYQSGGVAIAQAAKVDILPIYHNAGKFWAKGSFIKKPGTIIITIGKPINIDNKKPTQVIKDIQSWTLKISQNSNNL